jgi:carbon-monoxide dehydrogenase catalytic subunit
MAEEEKEVKKEVEKKKKQTGPKSIDPATLQMIARAEELEIETIFDRAEKMKPCPIGSGGTCCKNCSQGPCRLPLPKAGIEGEDERKGLCGATANTIAARNFIRMIAGLTLG